MARVVLDARGDAGAGGTAAVRGGRPLCSGLGAADPCLGSAGMSFDPAPVRLTGRHVRLEPLERRHAPALLAAAQDPEVFRWFLTPPLGDPAEMARWLDDALRAQASGTEVVFATVRVADGRVVGSTRFLDLRRPHRSLEIGHTWLAREAQRTAINTEAKLLMLTQAFEGWGAARVQLKTDERNAASRAAIARLGCTFEGVLRKYQARHDGFIRNTAMYSLIDEEWPAVKPRLQARLQARLR